VVQDTTVRGLDTSTSWHCHAEGEKTIEVPKGILVVDLGGDTWRQENLFDISASGDMRGCVV
jgi:hypothetical protein